MTFSKIWACALLMLVLACNDGHHANDASSQSNTAEADTNKLSVDEKIQNARKKRAGQANLSSAVRYAASTKEYAFWGEMAMQSKYGKPAHNFGYTLLAPPNAILMSMDQGFIQLLTEPENRDLLDELMGNYLIVNPVDIDALEKFEELEMANGKKWKYDKATKKLGEIEINSKSNPTNNGHVIETKNLPFFPKKELEKRYLKRKQDQ